MFDDMMMTEDAWNDQYYDPELYWKGKEGLIAFSSMPCRYALNVAKMLERKGKNNPKGLTARLQEIADFDPFS
jgi:hypothetical protein